MARTPFNGFPFSTKSTAVQPSKDSWWITPTGRIDPQQLAREQARMTQITETLAKANGEPRE